VGALLLLLLLLLLLQLLLLLGSLMFCLHGLVLYEHLVPPDA
jgi:hypothetical protein